MSHRCTSCHRELQPEEIGRYACTFCQRTTAQYLQDIPGLFTSINTTSALIRESTVSDGMPGPSGKVHAPIPLRVDVLDLVGPGGISARLLAIVDSWRTARGFAIRPRSDPRTGRTFAPWRSNPIRDVPAHVDWLYNNLTWSCDHYENVHQDIREIRRIHQDCTGTQTEEAPERRFHVLCPCGSTLRATLSTPGAECPCGARYSREDLLDLPYATRARVAA